jgi:hypothetical protein
MLSWFLLLTSTGRFRINEVTVSSEARCDKTCAVLEVAACDGGSSRGRGPNSNAVDSGPCVVRCAANEGEAGGELSDLAYHQLKPIARHTLASIIWLR